MKGTTKKVRIRNTTPKCSLLTNKPPKCLPITQPLDAYSPRPSPRPTHSFNTKLTISRLTIRLETAKAPVSALSTLHEQESLFVDETVQSSSTSEAFINSCFVFSCCCPNFALLLSRSIAHPSKGSSFPMLLTSS